MRHLARTLTKDTVQLVSRGTFVWRGGGSQGIFLTFDDGPNEEHTEPLLAFLREARVKATFFLIGDKVEKAPTLAKAIVDEGHAVGGHSYAHDDLRLLSASELKDDLDRTRAAIRRATGLDSLLFRPPFGRLNARVLRVAKNGGYKLVHWSRTYSDYLKDGAKSLWSRYVANPPDAGDIVMLHDDNPHTLSFVPDVIAEVRARRLTLEALAQR